MRREVASYDCMSRIVSSWVWIIIHIAQRYPILRVVNKEEDAMKTVDQLLKEARAILPYRRSPQDTSREIGTGTLVIDIRGDEQQRRDGVVPGAIILRRNVLEWRCDPQSEWRDYRVTSHDQRIILICDEGYQSSLAAANLQLMGMRNATDMSGGFQQWRREGLPVSSRSRTFAAIELVKSILRKVKL